MTGLTLTWPPGQEFENIIVSAIDMLTNDVTT